MTPGGCLKKDIDIDGITDLGKGLGTQIINRLKN